MSKNNKKIYPELRRRIVCFAGGNVVPKIILEPLKDLDLEVVGITSMVDNGGSTGALRREFDILPPGDIRRHLLALSEAEEWKKELWNFRFGKNVEISPGHFGHNFANIFLGGLEHILGDFEKALEIAHQFLKVKGKALPATLDKVQLRAELEDGTIIEGEDRIDAEKYPNRGMKIKRIYLDPDGQGYPKAIKEIKTADFLILGPGDLYSSILPCFLPKGIKEAVKESKAKKIFICPLMTKNGETAGFTAKEFCAKTEEYIGAPLDFVIFNNLYPSQERVDAYKQKTEFLEELFRAEEGLDKNKFFGADLILEVGDIKHDKEKVIKLLKNICKL
ncbi:MAG: hypothetical protein A3A08_02875 [Candidatus Nealsonbacteria bacterium RIFCSPLOWO2_01_FULL_41_9]|uniref:Gluconeogenesis factor n=1 Tax=Candidatus Nealsonbacteria bacterium RIFCSPLOWO2_01_FULL_41_9 TaxID=1801671 RepID=A0A1G2EDU4_9BACT|nr:MAG: hypothetical protein A3A08_02875 [Candidatus Nealsonbacteria bacterium RIFCSPLOWO2_01_FULL_41_9]